MRWFAPRLQRAPACAKKVERGGAIFLKFARSRRVAGIALFPPAARRPILIFEPERPADLARGRMRDPIAIVVDRRPRSIGGIRELANDERGADRAALRREARRPVPPAIFFLRHIADRTSVV